MSRASKVKEWIDDSFCKEPSERCCGAACDQPQRDNELKLIGVQEYLRLYMRTVPLTDAQKHCMTTVETEYKISMMTYTG